ncbi:MAG TPA: hypothetical protein VMG58_17635, partial [Candidatus Sulfotelmatobacter sp.]|nr:hypothetical protein [Candidatus Sulfotelmatobacter sp.]
AAPAHQRAHPARHPVHPGQDGGEDREARQERPADEPASEQVETEAETPMPAVPVEEAAGPSDVARPGPLDGYRVVVQAFSRSGPNPRFPMYVRQFKQFMKTFDEGFDERRYGFAGMLDALRFCQHEGLFWLDRDRRGGVRVHPGPQYLTLTKSSEAALAPEDRALAELPQDAPPPPDAAVEEALLDSAPIADQPLTALEAPSAETDLPAPAAAEEPLPPVEAEPAPAEASEAEPAPAPAPRATTRKRRAAGTGTRTKRTPSAAGEVKKPRRPRAKKS